MPDLFDMDLRAARRDRAARLGAELFLHDRAFEDCLERLELTQRQFGRALLIGSPDPSWPEKLRSVATQVHVSDPGPLFAAASGGDVIVEDAWAPLPQQYDLVLAIGTLDTVNDLPIALRLIAHAMSADALFLGAMAGGETLPQLRAAMRAADSVSSGAAPHVHPRIEASALAPLLTDAGFFHAVVDVDRVEVSYPSLSGLIRDLRLMGATNILRERPRFLGRPAREAAAEAFRASGDDGRTRETFEILHLAGWTRAER